MNNFFFFFYEIKDKDLIEKENPNLYINLISWVVCKYYHSDNNNINTQKGDQSKKLPVSTINVN